MTGTRPPPTRGGASARPYGKRGNVGRRWDDEPAGAIADEFAISARWVGMLGWRVVIHKKALGESWEQARVEVYEELDALELMQVLESSLGRWFAI